jgi:hypothetical protein
MASDVVANRRETRRRRILENSENRLQKITGRSDNISRGNILILYNVCYVTLNKLAVTALCADNESADF